MLNLMWLFPPKNKWIQQELQHLKAGRIVHLFPICGFFFCHSNVQMKTCHDCMKQEVPNEKC